MKLKPLLAALSLATASLASQAGVYDLGVLSVAPADPTFAVHGVTAKPSTFTDWWSFSVPTNASLVSFASNTLLLSGFTELFGLKLSITNTIGGTAIATGYQSLNDITLSPGGSYYLGVTGKTAGTHGGVYSLLAQAAPVPEPSTYAMLGLGIGVLALMRRRRKPEETEAEAPGLAHPLATA
ncbi:MAG TPA: FxDxF family PEP-CTERM protein [Ideonella sp.]|uniref:FxDxF family PEP-CTERM protein n=1 Tax=Ideonella sp. TaxID=1929293 RepID=UPI002CA947E1|nr:FxDxF family PEP-CTERM protein [Ideonella sp.]HSI47909.1 FxDxF family PEP-CTERM protein [Ideonella sp.]